MPRVVCSSAIEKTGLDDIWGMIMEYMDHCKKDGYFDTRRRRQSRYWMYEFIHDSLRSGFYGREGIRPALEKLEQEVLEGRKTSFHAAMEILALYHKGK
jgi:LAO/AO transport system kinase